MSRRPKLSLLLYLLHLLHKAIPPINFGMINGGYHYEVIHVVGPYIRNFDAHVSVYILQILFISDQIHACGKHLLDLELMIQYH